MTLATNSFLGDLRYFRFENTNCNVDARYYPNIGIDSFQYLVEHRMTGSSANPIVITVHPDIYAKLTAGDTDDDTAGKDYDWTALLELAASKNIQFAQP
ncbi:MAG: hypothetical protein K2L97_01200 [Muribaculaceae bacterium]|nr:hypothetical protein [Muribaculaceae bacterium]